MDKQPDWQAVPPHAEPNIKLDEWDHEDYWFWRYCYAGLFVWSLFCLGVGIAVGRYVL